MKKITSAVLLLLFMLTLLPGALWAQESEVRKVTVKDNHKIEIQISDAAGNGVALGQPVDNVSYVILSKPEGAKVTAQTQSTAELERAGKLTMAFSCDTVGTVQVQVLVRLANTAKYYTGIQTFQVVESLESKSVVMSIGSRQLIVDDQISTLETAPVIDNGRTFVPLRALVEAFGAVCSYDAATQQIRVQLNGTTVQMQLEDVNYSINDQPHVADAAPYLNADTTMVPIRLLAEAFGIQITPTYNTDQSVSNVLFRM